MADGHSIDEAVELGATQRLRAVLTLLVLPSAYRWLLTPRRAHA